MSLRIGMVCVGLRCAYRAVASAASDEEGVGLDSRLATTCNVYVEAVARRVAFLVTDGIDRFYCFF